MLQVSLSGIKLHAPVGLYQQETVLGNRMEVDVVLWLPDALPWPYADYGIIRQVVADTFAQHGQLLETFVYNIHKQMLVSFPVAEKVRVAVRKYHPPMPGEVDFAQVCYEK